MLWKFSNRAMALKSSAIREILKITEQPDVISFAGGLPSPNTFPVTEIKNAFNHIIAADEMTGALQYGPTEGYAPLRIWLAQYLSRRDHTNINPNQILIVTGSQQALDLIGKALIDKGSKVLVETPTYLGGLQSFTQYEPEYISLESDEQGIIPDVLDDNIAAKANFMYVIPNFQNPTGRRLPLARRQQLAKKAIANNLTLVEDDPYGELDYQGHRLPSLYTLAPENTIYLGSFSKILAPGLRLGYIVANEELINKLVQLKQAADLHTPSLTQRIAYHVIKDGFLETHIPKIRDLYRHRCQTMLNALQRYMPTTVTWNKPEGGMFIWIELPKNINATELLSEAIQHKVAFVPGETFFANTIHTNCMRLAFVTVPEEKIEQGVSILAQLITKWSDALEQSPTMI
ncbi:PLP-dependent aminotransferase family protein [Candidatus Schmidhempelia bombi]|jgi:2-aminoadipate transaminase|uniref:PLP-dependent aminotransferase family protein n=1 Tax=Candidatus Schmidhempelia bombi str. Bimp TaxID=1387197 RepID=A0AB94ID33_9GAMM|nr:PLP-dependent aminotransferase family protein [Candidatus Schmidhempelia bombi]TEA27333.1 PLP-dependent aminotransferase family protein [Candidatus Schmidhempelia bombi str. Bimp]